ncbi:hypothetical protein BH10PSE1_BH10PSE1_11090 [soil metagenome]
MKIAIQDSWPNLPENAEKEFIQRFHIACNHLGIESCAVVTSQDIEDADPDMVLVSHEFTRKLTGYPTIGLVWSPTHFFSPDPYRLKSLLSYDGYAAANDRIRLWLDDHTCGVAVAKPVSEKDFLPTTYRWDVPTSPFAQRLGTAAYVGVHWDGDRHADLFRALADQGLARFFGPPASWSHVGEAYGGFLAFDGRSVLDALSRHAAVLCLHKEEHREENTPSMRIFEACSVGAIPICDDIAFARQHLSDIALFVDMDQDPASVAEQVHGHLDWIRSNPDEAAARAERGRAWFETHWSLEARIENTLLPLYRQVVDAGGFAAREVRGEQQNQAGQPAVCEVVIRTGGRDMSYLKRALHSVRAASSAACRVDAVVVDYKSRSDVAALCGLLSDPAFGIRYLTCQDTGYRSTALWAGLDACQAPFVAHLDDDDTVAPNHYRQLVATLAAKPRANVAYSGVVLVQDEPDTWFKFPNHDGSLGVTIKENRDLKFLDAFDIVRMARFDNFIQSNAWLARREFVAEVIGPDPRLIVVEDVYLYLLMASAGPFLFTGSPTACWHWRSPEGDNSMFAVPREVWREQSARVRRRLSRTAFVVASLPSTLAELPDSDWQTLAYLAPERLKAGESIGVGSGFEDRFPCEGFHPTDNGGELWSRERTASITLGLTPDLIASGGVLTVTGRLGPVGARPDRWMQLSLLSGSAVRAPMPDDRPRAFTLEIPVGAKAPLTLAVTVSHFSSSAGASARSARGARIETIALVETAGFTPSRSERVLTPSSPEFLVGDLEGYGLLAGSGPASTLRLEVRGVVLVGDGLTVFAGRLEPGEPTSLPSSETDAAWFLAIPDRIEEAGQNGASLSVVLSGPSNDDFDLSWTAFTSSVEGRVQSHFADTGGIYEHLSFLIAGQSSLAGEASDHYFLFQRMDRLIYWEVRPSYGLAWDMLSAYGTLSSDDAGPISRGEIGPDVGLVSPALSREATAFLGRAIHGLVMEAQQTDDLAFRRFLLMILHRLASLPPV